MAQKLEIGKPLTFEDLKKRITESDCNVNLKMAIVVQCQLGSLIAFRDACEEYMIKAGGGVVYVTITSDPVYAVKWNDLSQEKQKNIERKNKK